jgi:hypothetical protein
MEEVVPRKAVKESLESAVRKKNGVFSPGKVNLTNIVGTTLFSTNMIFK